MTGLAANLLGSYDVSSQGESGDGRYDLSLKSKTSHRVIIMEFKVFDRDLDKTIEDTARRARQQIDDKRYDARFLSTGIPGDAIIKYGIGFKGKKVRVIP